METIRTVFRSEFCLKQFGFSTIVYDRVFFSQWRLPPITIIIYKLILTVYVDFWLVKTAVEYTDIDISGGGTFIVWPAFLTNWTYTLLALHLTMSTVAIIVYHLVRFRYSRLWLCSRTTGVHWTLMQESENRREITTDSYSTESFPETAIVRSESTPWYVVVLWMLYDMAAGAVPLVTLMFFAFLWPNMNHSDGIGVDNLQLHGLNTVCMLVDFAFSPIPVRLLHVIYPLIYGLIYVIFSAIYWARDHNRVLYPGVLDWNAPGKTIGLLFGVIAILLVLQFILFCLHKLKTFIYHKLYSSDYYESISN